MTFAGAAAFDQTGLYYELLGVLDRPRLTRPVRSVHRVSSRQLVSSDISLWCTLVSGVRCIARCRLHSVRSALSLLPSLPPLRYDGTVCNYTRLARTSIVSQPAPVAPSPLVAQLSASPYAELCSSSSPAWSFNGFTSCWPSSQPPPSLAYLNANGHE